MPRIGFLPPAGNFAVRGNNAGPVGFEPTTSGLRGLGRYLALPHAALSSRLSYGPKGSTPGTIRGTRPGPISGRNIRACFRFAGTGRHVPPRAGVDLPIPMLMFLVGALLGGAPAADRGGLIKRLGLPPHREAAE